MKKCFLKYSCVISINSWFLKPSKDDWNFKFRKLSSMVQMIMIFCKTNSATTAKNTEEVWKRLLKKYSCLPTYRCSLLTYQLTDRWRKNVCISRKGFGVKSFRTRWIHFLQMQQFCTIDYSSICKTSNHYPSQPPALTHSLTHSLKRER